MVPRGNDVWFFKVMGPETAVALIQSDLKSFVENVTFENGDPKLDDLPDSWQISGTQSQFRFASINVETPEKQLDVSVSKLGRQPDWDAMVSANVNRWRGQLGLEPSDATWADGEPLDVASADDKSVWVDLSGIAPSGAAPMMGGAMTGGAPKNTPAPGTSPLATSGTAALPPMPPPINPETASKDVPPMEPDPRLDFDRPDGWRDGRMNSMRMAAFNVGPEDRPAEITVIPAGGDLRGNVARWLGQVRGEVAPDEMVDAAMEAATDITVDGRDGKRFTLGGEGKGDGTAIDATIIPIADGMSLFIKMTGPEETLQEQSQKISEFLKSMRLKM